MRVLVISDIHANLAAFEAVLEDARGQWEFVWCLGDVVGYGPDPNECCELLRSLPHLCLAGNHDWAALARLDIRTFNADARRAVTWTRETLTPDNLAIWPRYRLPLYWATTPWLMAARASLFGNISSIPWWLRSTFRTSRRPTVWSVTRTPPSFISSPIVRAIPKPFSQSTINRVR